MKKRRKLGFIQSITHLFNKQHEHLTQMPVNQEHKQSGARERNSPPAHTNRGKVRSFYNEERLRAQVSSICIRTATPPPLKHK